MRLITEKRDSARVRVPIPVRFQRLSAKAYEQRKRIVLNVPTSERTSFGFGTPEVGSLPDAASPAQIAILQSLKALHQKVDRLLELLQSQQANTHTLSADSIDLSASGMRFSTDLELHRGEALSLVFSLPSHSATASPGQRTAIEMLAEVVNISQVQEGWTVAVNFSAIHPSDQHRIEAYCDQILGR